MKTALSVLLFGIMGVLSVHNAMAGELGKEACYGGYSVLLVTDGECKAYLDQRQVLETSHDQEALKNLDAAYAIKLAERSETCPCAARASRYIGLNPIHVSMR